MRRALIPVFLPTVTIGALVAAGVSLVAAIGGNAASSGGQAPAAAGSRIAFASTRGVRKRLNDFGASEIYVIRTDGTRLKRLTRNGLLDRSPAWSPDGRKIAFARQMRLNGDDYRIYVVSAGGGSERALTPPLLQWPAPAWSPNGRKIAFAAGGDAITYPAIWIMNADGSGRRPLKVDPAHVLGNPAWSPNGTRIAFWSWDPVAEDATQRIYVMNADGSEARPITSPKSSFDDHTPAWSPDGRTIAFTRVVGDGTFGQIWLVRAAGGGERRIARDAVHPSWSPDGRRIAFDGQFSYSGLIECRVLYLARADGSRRSVLRPRGTRSCARGNGRPNDWDPAWHK